MRVALTGTPGTGKTTVAEHLDDDLPVVHLNEAVEREGLWTDRDTDRDTLVVDVEALEAWLAREGPAGDHIVESHLAHLVPADRVVVLRCHPAKLTARLRDRDVAPGSIEENAESEALDVVLSEAVAEHGREAVYEIDTTDAAPAAVARAVEAVVEGRREPTAGAVDFTDWL